jgi:hypothetical protein
MSDSVSTGASYLPAAMGMRMRSSLAGVLRVEGQKDDTANEGWKEHQASCPDDGLTENQRKTAQNSGEDCRAEKQRPLAPNGFRPTS